MKSQFPDQGESWKMWFSGEDRLRKGPKEMEEQKQAEQQWNKIRRERINILKEAPSEENLWQAVMAFQDYPFKTVTGLPFQYTLKTGKNGEWTKELWIDRREKSKSLSWSSVVLAFKNSRKTTEVVERPKALGDIRGISYIYPILWRLELIRVPEKFKDFSVTNLSAAEVTYLGTLLFRGGFQDAGILSIKGEASMGETYAEFHVDEQAMYEMVLEVFYRKAGKDHEK